MIIINMIIISSMSIIITTCRVSVEEWEFVEASKERRSLAVTVGAEPHIRSSLTLYLCHHQVIFIVSIIIIIISH